MKTEHAPDGKPWNEDMNTNELADETLDAVSGGWDPMLDLAI